MPDVHASVSPAWGRGSSGHWAPLAFRWRPGLCKAQVSVLPNLSWCLTDRKRWLCRLINGFRFRDLQGSMLPRSSNRAVGLKARAFSHSVSQQYNISTMESSPRTGGAPERGVELRKDFQDDVLFKISYEWEVALWLECGSGLKRKLLVLVLTQDHLWPPIALEWCSTNWPDI